MDFNFDFSRFINTNYLTTDFSFWIVIALQVFIIISILFIHYHFAKFSPNFDIGGKVILFVMDLLFLVIIYNGFKYFSEIFL